MTLDDLIGAPHFRNRHARRVAASPEQVWEALHELRLADLRLARALVAVRNLPERLAGAPAKDIVSGRLLEDGPVPVLAADEPRSIVGGALMQPWKLRGGEEPPRLDAAGLRAFAEPGWVKTGLDFTLQADGTGTRLSTETRIKATDRRSRIRFGVYWLAIRAGSGLIRRDMLRQVARQAEAAAAGR